MGFSVGSLHHLTTLGRSGHIPRAGRYLDFGSQNIAGELARQLVEDFLATFSSKDRYSPKLTAPGAKIEDLMAAADFEYIAFDTFSEGKTRKFDLNFDGFPESLCGTFDVVANYGTSEHVANQYNLFKVAHDALKVGGVMHNFLPFFGGINHGLFNYHPKFFTTLIANNSYQPLYWDFSDVFKSGEDYYKDLSTAGSGSAWESKYMGTALMNIIFKKTASAPFRPPTDAVLAGDIHVAFPTVNEILKRAPPWKPLAMPEGGLGTEIERMRIAAEVEILKQELEAIRSSNSWRVTAPLRSVARWARRLRA
jgi:hypothetical protein